ncbi:DUF4296 domain-containing protein [Flammeovirga yaeyamensis]|uniref:DUF4296 domain-containing protein n=1 Tax=Flammeovirga yaeyamensis TaxID=367791 RepID=A0AAX1N8H9_9BACT|nr:MULTISPECIES: DUF4296 domain-containing protein [Flammeovirga]ANQ50349.2 DUF4296 domain-containing protein [Flammeovirga sp. MY04]MBB3699695.1 hypothetical protein [Flammeovirga yaeyamensis]NMF36735.1 DUF4296 domain-containing protein [Flammeovirga yaeyamensis]QWG02223.1 DUF4296 domain-containing protein [Flammeovirga yaeyamensis]
MKRILKVLALGLILVSCAPKEKAQAPADLLSKDVMVKVLIDLYKAEATVSTQHLPKDEAMNAYVALQDDIYTNNNVDSAVFNKSYNFYLNHRVDEAAEIQKTVVETLKQEKEALSLGADKDAKAIAP